MEDNIKMDKSLEKLFDMKLSNLYNSIEQIEGQITILEKQLEKEKVERSFLEEKINNLQIIKQKGSSSMRIKPL